MDQVLVLNDREAAAVKDKLSAVDKALLPANTFALTSSGLAAGLIEKHSQMLKRRKQRLEHALNSYEALRARNPDLLETWRHEPGVVLVLTRIYRGLSQRQLAEKLGMREQQIQRYEADRYRSISLSNLKRICASLGVRLSAELQDRGASEELFLIRPDKLDRHELKRVLSYVKDAGWIPGRDLALGDEEGVSALINYATSIRDRFGSPTLLRAGQNKGSQLSMLSLHAWRARIAHIVEPIRADLEAKFDPTDISWLRPLVQLSSLADGPRHAVEFLNQHGIILVVVPAVPGSHIDGAAFLDSGVPIVALTLRFDRIDYFWFTLLHELGHIFLHLDDGLSGGFFDDLEQESNETIEVEANEFAASSIVPPELWRLSPARLATSPEVVNSLAHQLRISPALIFGKLRNERRDYKIFTKELGQGAVRQLFTEVIF